GLFINAADGTARPAGQVGHVVVLRGGAHHPLPQEPDLHPDAAVGQGDRHGPPLELGPSDLVAAHPEGRGRLEEHVANALLSPGSRFPAPYPTASRRISGSPSAGRARAANTAAAVGVTVSSEPPGRTSNPLSSSTVTGAGSGISGWPRQLRCTPPEPSGMGPTRTSATSSHSRAAATPTTSRSVSASPNSWSSSSAGGMPCTADSPSPRRESTI